MDRLKPIPPSPEDCCGQGCTPCVNDIYEAELKLWEKEVAQKSSPETNSDNEKSHDKKEFISRDIYSSFKIKEIRDADACISSSSTGISLMLPLRRWRMS